MPYLGNEPAVAYTSTTKDTFSGDASTTDFTMSKSANVNAVRVVVENVVQNPTVAYTCSGTTLSFTSAPPTGTNNIYVVHLGPPAATVAPPTTINNATTFTGGVTFKNGTPEDTDGGRESILTFKGVQSGEEESTLAQIQAAHDGSSDDEKGLISFKTNDGNDSNSPTERWRITSDGHFKAMVNGYGIDFSATEGTNASSSVLDDYEEGQWTISFPMSTSGSYTARAGYTGAYYTKVGNLVTVFARFETLGESSPVGNILMSGFPFTFSNSAPTGGNISSSYPCLFRGYANSGDNMGGFFAPEPGTTRGNFYMQKSNTDYGYSTITPSDVGNFEGAMQFTYITS